MKRIFLTIAERYYLSILNDAFRTAFLVLQPLVITLLFILVFRNSENSSTFKLLLVITAIWLGLINSCQEIVKDLDLFRMERRFGVKASVFILSKQSILSLIAFVQIFIMIFGLYSFTRVKFSFAWYFIILFLTSMCSVSLGLLISSFSSNSNQALAIAPIITIPQILFNNILIEKTSIGIVDFIKNIMISKWALLFMENLDNSMDFKALSYLLVIVVFGIIYSLISILILKLE